MTALVKWRVDFQTENKDASSTENNLMHNYCLFAEIKSK